MIGERVYNLTGQAAVDLSAAGMMQIMQYTASDLS